MAEIAINADEANVPGVNFLDQGSKPTAPAAGHHLVYTKSGGVYVEAPDGTEVGPLGVSSGSGSGVTDLYDVTQTPYNATRDGTTDDKAAIQAAFDAASAADGGIIYFPPGTYRLASGVSYTAQKKLLILGHGAILLPDAGVTALLIHQDSAGICPGTVTVEGLTIDGTAKANNAVGIEVRDTDYCTLKSLRMYDLGIGIHVTTESLWTEGLAIEDVFIKPAGYGIKVEALPGAVYPIGSTGEAHLRNVGLSVCDVGLYLGPDIWHYRWSMQNVVCWVLDNQKGVVIAGNVYGGDWQCSFETFTGMNSNIVGIEVQSGASNTDHLIWNTDWTGPWGASKVSLAFGKNLRLVEQGGTIRTYKDSFADVPLILETYHENDTEPRLQFANQMPVLSGGVESSGIMFGKGGNTPPDTNFFRKDAGVIGTTNALSTGTFTEATKPTAAAAGAGAIIYVSDAAANQHWQASNGSTWVYLDGAGGTGVSDHGELDGLADDDHTQYLNLTRHAAIDHTGITGCAGGDPGGGGITRIGQVVVGAGGSATIAFSGIPGTYTDLRLTVNGRCSASSLQALYIRFNGDTGANYDNVMTNPWTDAGREAAVTGARIGAIVGTNSTANWPAITRVEIYNYAATVFQKRLNYDTATIYADINSAYERGAAGWRNTAAITDIVLYAGSGNFVEGTTATLWGIT